MTQQEFKAWFEGFTESMEKAPTAKQWARIKERVAEIDGKPVTERVFIDRYWPTYYPYWISPVHTPYYTSPTITCGSAVQSGTSYNVLSNIGQNSALGTYDSTQAMYTAGKADQFALSST